jgi:hypothetical protein
MRVWRTLKGLGSAALRDGVYLMPHGPEAASALQQVANEVVEFGGTAQVLRMEALNGGQEAALQRMFDRSGEYARLMEEIEGFRQRLQELNCARGRRTLARLRREFESLAGIDFFPGEARSQTEAALDQAAAEFDALVNPGEPRAVEQPLQRLDVAEFRNRIWATRQRPWVDRLASAWLIRRFIDPGAQFLWIESPEDCPPDALGFDFDGARFTHVGSRVTFETLVASFGLEQDSALARIGALVHYLDVGGLPVVEAAGVETILAGLRQRSAGDDALLIDACCVFESLYTAFAEG